MTRTLLRVFLISMITVSAFVFFNGQANCTQWTDDLVVDTVYGKIKGKEWNTGTSAWLGVPYAKPPINELRWKAPRDAEPWEGIRITDHFKSAAMQYGGMLLDLDPDIVGDIVGDEDCLYLNIWRPQTEETDLPVFVYLHGGLNAVGASSTSLYHGANLAEKSNMVVVTVNFRLGIFGWFAHEALKTGDSLDDSGNYGLLDIIKSLKWVQDNISAFGGDPGNVTFAGESGSGFNALSLMASPLANGLFHKAISMSSIGSLESISMKNAQKRADIQLIKLVKNDGHAKTYIGASLYIQKQVWQNPDWIKEYLAEKEAAEIIACTTPLTDLEWTGISSSIGITADSLGASRISDGTVIPLNFKDVFKNGDYNRVPLIIGSNTDEMRIFLIAFGLIPNKGEEEICRIIQDFDPNNPNISLNELVPPVLQPFYALTGSTMGNAAFEEYGIDPVAKDMTLWQDVYVYKFAWNNQPAPFDFLVGASHMMELPFVFGNFQTDENSMFRFAWSDENRSEVEELSDAIMGYYANFANTGNPNTGEYVLPEWTPWSNDKDADKRLILDAEISMTDE